jgi:hypothetical protein
MLCALQHKDGPLKGTAVGNRVAIQEAERMFKGFETHPYTLEPSAPCTFFP